MERKLTLKEKIQIFVKNQPKTSAKTLSIMILVLAIIFFATGIISNATDDSKIADVSSAYTEDRIVKGSVFGDMMLGRAIRNKASDEDYKNIFNGVSKIWSDSDYVSGNLECALLDDESQFTKNDKEIHISAETKTVNVLKDNGFTLINLANNHLADFNAEGVISTINTLKSAGLRFVGAGENIVEASQYDLQEINGVKIATVSVSDIIPKNFSATDAKAGILSTNTTRYYQAVREASKVADLVIVNIHWGVEYGVNETKEQQQIGRNLINFGADIVIGSHPHALQPVEKYNNGIIFYSMGNFVFDQGWSRTKDSMILNYFVDDAGNCSFEIVPVRIKDGYPTVTTNPLFKNRIFNTVTKRLSDADYEIKSNRIIIKDAIKLDLQKNQPTTTEDGTATGTDTTTDTTTGTDGMTDMQIDNTGNVDGAGYTEDGINY